MELIITELENNPTPSGTECDVCQIDFFKKYLPPKTIQKNLEKHYTTANHKHNVQRSKLGLPPERLYNFSNANEKLTELIQKLEDRIGELSQIPTPCGVTAPTEEEDVPQVKESIKERIVEQMPKPIFKIGIDERTLLYDYDGYDYTTMRNISALLTRLLYWIRTNMHGERMKTNANYVDTTFVAVQAQMVHRINGYKNEKEEVEDIGRRLMNIAEHDWTGD